MTKKLCTAVGCKTIVEHDNDGSSPRCDKHPKEYSKDTTKERKKRYVHQYDSDGKNIYGSYRWRKLRNQKAKLNPICEHCEEFGVAKPVEEVDHVIELEDGGEVWNINNLQSLCKRCHIIKTEECRKARLNKRDQYGYLVDSSKLKR